MTTLNISLPDSMRTFIDQRLKTGDFSTTSEYIRQLIREDKKNVSTKFLESKLLEGLQSGESTTMTKRDWKEIHETVQKKLRPK